MIYDLSIRATTGQVMVIFNGKFKTLQSFIHPITNKKLYMFESTKKILNSTYLMSGIGKKTRYANIFDDDMQLYINEYLKK